MATRRSATESGRTRDDHRGQIERRGVEYIPEGERDSHPRNLAFVFIGANLTFGTILYGWLPFVFGMGLWSNISSLLVGKVLGTLVVVALGLIGPRTGTNLTVSSGAFFGIRGRFIGSALTLAIALMFAALTVWTSGDAIVSAFSRLLGTTAGDGAYAVGYGIIAVLIVLAALYGHATIVALEKGIVLVGMVALLLGVFAFAGDFDPSAAVDGGYLLGSYWPTWIFCVILSAAGPVSYAPNIGDYTRRISPARHSDRSVALWLSFGLIVGTFVPSLFGVFTGAAFADITAGSYVTNLVEAAPIWYVFVILLIGLLGGLGQGTLCVYSSGLDLEGVLPRLNRVQTTLLTAGLAIVLLYVGTFVFDAVDSITAATLLLNALMAPWVVILAIGALRARSRGYDPDDLQAFADGRRGGRYWFTGGWNVPAAAAWAVGSVLGVLTVNGAPLYVGAVRQHRGGHRRQHARAYGGDGRDLSDRPACVAAAHRIRRHTNDAIRSRGRGTAMKVHAFLNGGDYADLAINDPLDENVGTKQYSPYFFYLVEHPQGRVLFDTGLHPDLAQRWGASAAEAFPIEMYEGGDLVGQLQKLGLRPEDIDAVVPSHLHFDHAGGLEFVAHAPVYVQATELDFARNPPAYQADLYMPQDFEHDLDWRLLEGDHDLFGDGRVRIISTPGHTRGHQSLLVTFEERAPLVLLGDAAYNLGKMRERRLPAIVWSPDAMVASWERVEALEREVGAELICTHESDFAAVPIAPDGYWS
ncbi:cytosine permease [Microbacterium sp. W4I20]|uniref:cytosine permease n=1 Tax=Microbacterium sp. W4I20 TaxID=3042262 RepID=UPI0027D8C28B|nr:cytosine permease [Microbacterium sp. W4I20]